MALVKTIDFKVTKGMCLDIEEQSNLPNTAFELYNIKNLIIGGKALGALTNELGTKKPQLVISDITKSAIAEKVNGTVIGIVPCGSTTAAVFVKWLKSGTLLTEEEETEVETTEEVVEEDTEKEARVSAKKAAAKASGTGGNTLTATFIVEDNNTITKLANAGDSVEFPTVSSINNNDEAFIGWYNFTTEETITASTFTMPSTDVTFLAIYSLLLYSVKFFDYDLTLLQEDTLYDGDLIVPPTNPTREGYIFSGWLPPLVTLVDGLDYQFIATYYIDDTYENVEDTEIDYIYRLDYIDEVSPIKLTVLAEGDFLFGDYIEGLYVEENSTLQKVYWVDGKNQLRYINIANTDSLISDDNYLNTNPRFKIDHHITVEKQTGGGTFTAGVIQYAFTYYIENGPETGIVDMTPLYYISDDNRGIAADETVGCSFKISILNPDTFFDYIRVYSITRTTLDGTPVVRIVKDIKL